MKFTLRDRTTNRYFKTPNAIWLESWGQALSLKAKAIYGGMRMCAQLQKFEVDTEFFVQRTTSGRHAVLGAIRELEESRLIRRTQLRADGQFGSIEIELFDSPQSDFPPAVNSTTDKPQSVSQCTNKKANYKKANQEEETDNCIPVAELLNLYNTLCVPHLPGRNVITTLTPKRRRAFAECLNDATYRTEWRTALRYVFNSGFLRGEYSTQLFPGGFVMDIDTVLKVEFVHNMIEGKYHRGGEIAVEDNVL